MKASFLSCKNIVSRGVAGGSRAGTSQPWARAMLEVLQRRGHSYGLLALYEESRLGSHR